MRFGVVFFWFSLGTLFRFIVKHLHFKYNIYNIKKFKPNVEPKLTYIYLFFISYSIYDRSIFFTAAWFFSLEAVFEPTADLRCTNT